MKKILMTAVLFGALSVQAGDTWGTAGKVLAADKGIELLTGSSPVNQVFGKVGGFLGGQKQTTTTTRQQVVQQPVYYQPAQQMPQQQPYYQQMPQQMPQQVPTQQIQYRQNNQFVKVWKPNIVKGWAYQKSVTKYARTANGDNIKYDIKVYAEGPVDRGRWEYVPSHLAHQYQAQPQPVYVDTMKQIGGPTQIPSTINPQDIPDVDAAVLQK